MTSTVRQARSRSLSALCLFAGCVGLALSGCGGGGGNNGGGGGGGNGGGGGGGGTTNYTITVQSANPASGVVITYGNSGTILSAQGTTQFTLTESSGTTMIFGAPTTSGGNNFASWSGCTSVSGANCTVNVTGNVTITANYVTPVAPALTVTPSASTISTTQALSVTVGVAASQGGATPTGSVVLTSGSYTSASTALSNGSATINVSAGSLASGMNTLTATYTPDSASSVAYKTATGTGSVTVLSPPVMSIAPPSSSIITTQPLTVQITASGTPTPTGSIVLSSGSYTSASTILNAGVAVITVPSGSLAPGSNTLTATYTPDSASSSIYSSGTKTATVTVAYAVNVTSTNPGSGVSITVSPKDVNGNGSALTPISLAYGPNTAVTLTAPATSANGNTFNSWTGCSSTSGATCTLNVNAPATVTANYASVSVSPTTNVTIGQSQQFNATVTGLSPTTVTWTVAVASGTGSPGTISSSGLYQTPYPAPTSVTVTATSTANTAIKGTATITLAAPATTSGPALSIDAGTVTHTISPLIYGMNGYLLDPTTAQNANVTVVRWGGDATSRYNYQNGNSNSASDYYFQNGGTYAMLTNKPNNLTSEANFNDFLAETTALGIKSIGTAPVQGYVSNSSASACSFPKSSYPNQTSYNSSNCGNGIQTQGTQMPDGTTCNTSGGCSLFGSSTTWQTTSVQEPAPTLPASSPITAWAQATWTGGWINCLITTGANCASAAGKDASIWDLDNEPAWWDAVHRDVHPNPSTYDEVTNGGIGTALAIKTLDSNTQTAGPVIDYWWNYFYSKKDIESGWSTGPCYQPWSNPVDRSATAHSGAPMMVYYLQQMASASNTYGMRLLDYLTIHAYVAGSYNGSPVSFTTAGNTAEQQVRMNSTRALWDPTYTDSAFPQPNYTTDTGYTSSCSVPLQAPQIIPMMQSWITSGWTGTSYPAPATSIDEYNFGGLESINGAVTQADVLGIFGKYNLNMGVFWPTDVYANQTGATMAFEIYRNYDGNKSTFGDQELTSNTADQSKLAIYAASRTSDGAVTVVVINKTYGPLTQMLSINNLVSTATSAQVYQYSNANLNAIVAQSGATVTPPGSGSTISTVSGSSGQAMSFPAQSITLVVIPSH